MIYLTGERPQVGDVVITYWHGLRGNKFHRKYVSKVDYDNHCIHFKGLRIEGKAMDYMLVKAASNG